MTVVIGVINPAAARQKVRDVQQTPNSISIPGFRGINERQLDALAEGTIKSKPVATRWLERRETNALSDLSHLIKNGECIKDAPEVLKEQYSSLLSKLKNCIEEARTKPEGPDKQRILKKLYQTSDSLVNNILRFDLDRSDVSPAIPFDGQQLYA